jgi:membrane associated rhomboid family serine protease
VRAALLSPTTPVVSITLIILNVLWFLAGMADAYRNHVPLNTFLWTSTPEILHATGAVRGLDIVLGEWWRLLSCCFVHIGLLHLGVNMYSLYAVGPFLEQLWGHVRFLVLYLLAGLGGSCIAMLSNPTPLLAGASGALWGILSAHAIWIIVNHNYLPRPLVVTWLRQLGIVFLVNVLITWQVPNISASAHFGGGGVGAIAALFLNYERFGNAWQRVLALLGLAGIPVLLVGALVRAQTVDPRWIELHIPVERDEWINRYRSRVVQLWDEVKQIKRTEIIPLRRIPAEQDPELFAKAASAFHRARQNLHEAAELLRKAGPFRDSVADQQRQRMAAEVEAQIQLLEREETQELLLPWLATIKRDMLRTYQARAIPMLALDPIARPREDADDTISLLEQERAKLNQATEALAKQSPYQGDNTKTMSRLAIDWLSAEANLLDFSVDCLKAGRTWTQDQKSALEQQSTRARELGNRLDDLLKDLRQPTR